MRSTRLLSEDGELVNRATLQNPAEISVRGPTIMQGYLGNSEASNAAIDAEGWLKTGDLGYEEYGKFYIIDRKKVDISSPFCASPRFAD
jgi:long-subunit acyl-CoA synthetase (AMP-forming)